DLGRGVIAAHPYTPRDYTPAYYPDRSVADICPGHRGVRTAEAVVGWREPGCMRRGGVDTRPGWNGTAPHRGAGRSPDVRPVGGAGRISNSPPHRPGAAPDDAPPDPGRRRGARR